MDATITEHPMKIAAARNVFGEVIGRARHAGEPTVLVSRGKQSVAVVVSYDFYERAVAALGLERVVVPDPSADA